METISETRNRKDYVDANAAVCLKVKVELILVFVAA